MSELRFIGESGTIQKKFVLDEVNNQLKMVDIPSGKEVYLNQPVNVYDYIIFGEDTNGDGIVDIIYAKNGKTGEIEFESGNAREVVQYALDNGRNVYVANGKYYIDSTIKMLSDRVLVFESRDAKFYTDSAITMVEISSVGYDPDIGIYSTKGIFGGTLDGGGVANLVKIVDVEEAIIRGTAMINFVDGIEITAQDYWSEWTKIEDVIFRNYSGWAIKYTPTSGSGTDSRGDSYLARIRADPLGGGGGLIKVETGVNAGSMVAVDLVFFNRGQYMIYSDGRLDESVFIKVRMEDHSPSGKELLYFDNNHIGYVEMISVGIGPMLLGNFTDYFVCNQGGVEIINRDTQYIIGVGRYKYIVGAQGDTRITFAGNANMTSGNWVFDVRDDIVSNKSLFHITHGGAVYLGAQDYSDTVVMNRLRFASTTRPHFNIVARNTPPSNPAVGDIYLDDGTNTADGKPHFRYWDGTQWVDL